jgi:hypothetical protein
VFTIIQGKENICGLTFTELPKYFFLNISQERQLDQLSSMQNLVSLNLFVLQKKNTECPKTF